ncbi:MAG: RecQ family ATP-dependent DNA helicase [Alloprevotella sp.]|nr:RecQ family ATP-dependent DNA helicase [Alloprevotella sp.]
MHTDSEFLSTLKQYWGYTAFRGIQLSIIRDISAGNDVLGLMPTGGGKSLTFQVPALISEGLCLIVSPLISLMKDQVEHLKRRSIPAAAIYSGMAPRNIDIVLNNAVFGAYKLLYVSPERLESRSFLEKLRFMKISFLVVDEAHCISQWGYDFRPSYLHIAEIRQFHPTAPVLALTATATPRVVEDICRLLEFRHNAVVHRMSFARKNLAYVVRHTEDKDSELLHILRSVAGSAVVYVRSRPKTREVAKLLNESGISALYYHAGITDTDKDIRQKAWMQGDARVMVATNAFGMGIDKPDVRLVVHLDLPDSIEAYFQEAGRAGRDGLQSYAVLLHNGLDSRTLRRRVADTFPPVEYIRSLYDDIAFYYEVPIGEGEGLTHEFHMDEFCRSFKLFPTQVESALNLLTRAGYLNYREAEDSVSRVVFLTTRDQLYNYTNTQGGEEVVQALLRTYTGLFSDYVPIDENHIARITGFTTDFVYQILKLLNRQRIIHYIPRKNVPRITYVRRRLLNKELVFSPEVYDHRKKQYEERIMSMVHYAEQTEQCRSSVMLAYFGETEAEPCGQCDICRAQSVKPQAERDVAQIILNVLADGKTHPASDLRFDGIDTDYVARALQALSDEGKIAHSGEGFSLLS